MESSELTDGYLSYRLAFVIIRPKVTTQLVPYPKVSIAQLGYYICQCGTHGHVMLANGMELTEHIGRKAAYIDIERLCFSGFVKGNLGQQMRDTIAQALDFADSESTVHPDIVRRIREWNQLREEGKRPHPNNAHSFIYGAKGFRARVHIAKTVPLTKEPFGGYELIEEQKLPVLVDAALTQDP
ncbi:MAG: hypothetical protein AAB400_01665 [Patescibacteria group bacterium]